MSFYLDRIFPRTTRRRPPAVRCAASRGRWIEYETARPEFIVPVRVAPQMVTFLRNFQAGPIEPRGWVTGRLVFESYEVVRTRLLSYNGVVEVLKPEALRCRVSDHARETVRLYTPSGESGR
jgi:predicted DNA-binding transcriptional regulator YafY